MALPQPGQLIWVIRIGQFNWTFSLVMRCWRTSNTVKLTWGNNYTTGNYAYPNGQTPPPGEPEIPEEPKVEKKDTVTTYAGKVNLLKQGDKDGDGVMENLAGAEFTLTNDAGAATTGLKSDVANSSSIRLISFSAFLFTLE